MQRIKGFEQLVESLPFIDENIRIYFLGGDFIFPMSKMKRLMLVFDPYMWKFNSLITRLNNSDKIIKVGLVDNIFDYYNNSLALLSPFSKPHASLPVLEAFSVGKPVIVSDIEGMDEIVNKQNGFFFKNKNSKALAFVINRMAELDNIEYQKMSQNAKNKYLEIVNNNGSVKLVIDSVHN
jgi:glycosyltransferase involved in cell wall biosynthesis